VFLSLLQVKYETVTTYSRVQALGMFSSALQSGQLAPLMGQFGFSDDVMGAARRGGKPRICYLLAI